MPAAYRGGRAWARTVRLVVRRDGGICHLCGREDADSADHLIPWSKGGTNAMTNLRAVHHNVAPYCNRVRGNRTVDYARTRVTKPMPKGWDW